MKIQNLAVIFIIIILPISLILTSYTQSQVKTLSLQISYDSKLNNATYDALKAFQLNTLNSSTSDIANSKLRDIEASVNTFFNSISSNFNMAGYNKDILKNYVPALVYTMYDGYYIYSPYTNTLTDREDKDGATYRNNEKIYGLKPYIHYSCRYKSSSYDIVITYSLDNYITIQGTINGKSVYRYGYLLDNIGGNYTNGTGNNITYRGIDIGSESLNEYVDKDNRQTYVKINGVKYYNDNGQWYSLLNGKRYNQTNRYKINNEAAMQYYKEANDFTKWIKNNLGDLKTSDAVDENGNPLLDEQGNKKFGDAKVFDFGAKGTAEGSIEDANSDFNQHRLAVIRYSIEKNLSIAIANYNNYTDVKTNFQMPKLQEDEWTRIINNVSIISFLQGLNIGGKVYNGYSIITNTKNEEMVRYDSIYLVNGSDSYYYRPTDGNLSSSIQYTGIFNLDFERRAKQLDDGSDYYFYPQKQLGSYTSIVNNAINKNAEEDFYGYIDNMGTNVAKAYYTALGRERYSMYRTNNDINSEGMRQAYMQ